MKANTAFVISLLGIGQAMAAVPGFDISHWQSSVDFAAAYKSGARFVMIKATEGTTYQDPKFSQYYTAATKAGFVRGGYHFARPGETSGEAQADYFLAHGGGWTADGITLPGMLDLEAGCWGLSQSAMVAWIRAFSDRYKAKVGRTPMLYTNVDFWQTCTGNSQAFAKTNPLVLARWSSSPGTPPGGWAKQTIWQNSDHYTHGGDSDVFNGSQEDLVKFATNP